MNQAIIIQQHREAVVNTVNLSVFERFVAMNSVNISTRAIAAGEGVSGNLSHHRVYVYHFHIFILFDIQVISLVNHMVYYAEPDCERKEIDIIVIGTIVYINMERILS